MQKSYIQSHHAKYHHVYRSKFLMLKIAKLDGTNKWYRASPKLQHAINWHQKNHHENGNYLLLGRYINVPLTPYFANHFASIGVGKIIDLKWSYGLSNQLCTRSQFINYQQLQHLLSAYHYLRHDYDHYSCLQIFVNLYLWRKQEKNTK